MRSTVPENTRLARGSRPVTSTSGNMKAIIASSIATLCLGCASLSWSNQQFASPDANLLAKAYTEAMLANDADTLWRMYPHAYRNRIANGLEGLSRGLKQVPIVRAKTSYQRDAPDGTKSYLCAFSRATWGQGSTTQRLILRRTRKGWVIAHLGTPGD